LRGSISKFLDTENAHIYWMRDQPHDLVISMNFGRAATKRFAGDGEVDTAFFVSQ